MCEPCLSACNTAALFPPEWAQERLGLLPLFPPSPPGSKSTKPLSGGGGIAGHAGARPLLPALTPAGPPRRPPAGSPQGRTARCPSPHRQLCSHGNDPEMQMDGWSLQTEDGPSATQTQGRG